MVRGKNEDLPRITLLSCINKYGENVGGHVSVLSIACEYRGIQERRYCTLR